MGTGREFEAKTLDEALRAAAAALGRHPGDLDYEVLAEGRRGMFGLGQRSVRIWVPLPESANPLVPAVADAMLDAPDAADVDWVDEQIRRVIHLMDLNLAIHVEAVPGGVRAELSGPDRRILIARDAEVLTALQFLLGRIARQCRADAGRIQIELQGYRDQRARDLVERARRAARSVAETGEARTLGAMNAYERRIVHVTVEEIPGLVTHSVGEGPLKQVEIRLAPPRGEA